jgi:hypothetical protein
MKFRQTLILLLTADHMEQPAGTRLVLLRSARMMCMHLRGRTTHLDRPWQRPGALSYALVRLPGLLRPPADVDEPAPGSLSVLRDLPVVVRDGTTLRVDVVLPARGGRTQC